LPRVCQIENNRLFRGNNRLNLCSEEKISKTYVAYNHYCLPCLQDIKSRGTDKAHINYTLKHRVKYLIEFKQQLFSTKNENFILRFPNYRKFKRSALDFGMYKNPVLAEPFKI